MKKLALAVMICFASATALAAQADMKAGAGKDTKASKDTKAGGDQAMAGGMTGFMPHMPKNEKEDKKELEAMYKSMEDSMKKGDMSTHSEMVDFPVLMMTDNSKGQGMADNWDKAAWDKVMGESMKNMPADAMKSMKHDRKYDFVTDSLAVVTDTQSMTMNGKKMQWKTVDVLMKKDGKWMHKAMLEGGWGDTMEPGKGGSMGGSSGSMGGSSGSMGGSSGSMGGGSTGGMKK